MKATIPTMAISVIAAVAMAACSATSDARQSDNAIAPSGPSASRTIDATGFTAVGLGGLDRVSITHGSTFSVIARGNSSDLDDLDISVKGDSLSIRRKQNHNWAKQRRPLDIAIVMPRLEALSLGGSGDIIADRLTADNAELSVGGSGTIHVAALDAQSVKMNIGGSGDIEAAGKAAKASMSIAGSGNVKAARLVVASADIAVAGSGNVSGNVTSTADVSVMGSGNVTLTGGARCDSRKMGSGSVNCR